MTRARSACGRPAWRECLCWCDGVACLENREAGGASRGRTQSLPAWRRTRRTARWNGTAPPHLQQNETPVTRRRGPLVAEPKNGCKGCKGCKRRTVRGRRGGSSGALGVAPVSPGRLQGSARPFDGRGPYFRRGAKTNGIGDADARTFGPKAVVLRISTTQFHLARAESSVALKPSRADAETSDTHLLADADGNIQRAASPREASRRKPAGDQKETRAPHRILARPTTARRIREP
jgi:hypothetical protein